MADRNISELTSAAELLDDDLTVIYQANETKNIAGSALKAYARKSVLNYAQEAAATATANAEAAATAAEEAKTAAQAAEAAAGVDAQSAKTASTAAETAQAAAETAQAAAEEAQTAIENLRVSAETLGTGESATVEKALIQGRVWLTFGLPRGETGSTGMITAITRVSGDGSPGTLDTYAIETNYNQTFYFEVYNGANGQGTGDMLASVYDKNNLQKDVYTYADDALSNHNSSTNAHNSLFEEKADASTLREHIADTENPHSVTADQIGAETAGTAAGLLNRTTAVNAADTNYTTVMARGIMLMDSTTAEAVTDWTQYLHNGEICLFYEE